MCSLMSASAVVCFNSEVLLEGCCLVPIVDFTQTFRDWVCFVYKSCILHVLCP